MKVWIGYHCTHDLCDTWETVEKVFDDEVKALLWAEDPEFARTAPKWTDGTELEWRRYEERETE
jgi:hypothetical protein